jgi:hypothetical protein
MGCAIANLMGRFTSLCWGTGRALGESERVAGIGRAKRLQAPLSALGLFLQTAATGCAKPVSWIGISGESPVM